MHHFRERLKEEERRRVRKLSSATACALRDEEMMQSSNSWQSAQHNGYKDDNVVRGHNHLGIRSPTDDLLSDEPIVRLGRRGLAARNRTDTDPLGLRSSASDGAARARSRATLVSEDQGPTLEELLKKKAEARHEERLFEKRQLELADTLYPFGRRPESRLAMAAGSRRTSASSSIEEIEPYNPWGKGTGNPSPNQNFRRRSHERTIVEDPKSTEGTFFFGDHSSARNPRRVKRRDRGEVISQLDGDPEDSFPWERHRGAPGERSKAVAGLSFHEKMGWSTSDAKPKKTKEELREYLESLKDEMDGRRNRLRDEILQEAKSNTGDLATVMDHSLVGKAPISTALRRRTRHLL